MLGDLFAREGPCKRFYALERVFFFHFLCKNYSSQIVHVASAKRAYFQRWSVALCRADSDGDGRSNGEELGDPECVWRRGEEPATVTGLSHPGEEGRARGGRGEGRAGQGRAGQGRAGQGRAG